MESAIWTKRTFFIGVFGTAAVIFTLGATAWAAWAAHRSANAAKGAVDALPTLERAYLYSVVCGENVAQALKSITNNALKNNPYAGPLIRPSVELKLKNFGKTPARLVNGEIELFMHGAGLQVRDTKDWPIRYRHVLGPMEETEATSYALDRDIEPNEVQAIIDGRYRLYLYGFVTFLDVWGEKQTCRVLWDYNPVLRRMTPQEDYSAAKEGELSGKRTQ